jgi:hypothetical protein
MNGDPVERITSKTAPSRTRRLSFDFIDFRRLAKVDVAGSSPVSRSKNNKPDAEFRAGLFRLGRSLMNTAELMTS